MSAEEATRAHLLWDKGVEDGLTFLQLDPFSTCNWWGRHVGKPLLTYS